ncbi:MAG: FdtA/QdtA family cupin domain-containing protein [Candidatus Omnitrophota bacterium]
MAKKISGCKLLRLPKIYDVRGNLTFIESKRHVPFDIKRVYYIYDIPGGAYRGAHAHKNSLELIIPLAGSFDIMLDDGRSQKVITLNMAYYGLYVPNLIWRELFNFSSGATCLVLASAPFSEKDYIRNYDDFIKWQSRIPRRK